jgi:hypothetical protein
VRREVERLAVAALDETNQVDSLIKKKVIGIDLNIKCLKIDANS